MKFGQIKTTDNCLHWSRLWSITATVLVKDRSRTKALPLPFSHISLDSPSLQEPGYQRRTREDTVKQTLSTMLIHFAPRPTGRPGNCTPQMQEVTHRVEFEQPLLNLLLALLYLLQPLLYLLLALAALPCTTRHCLFAGPPAQAN